MSFDLNQYVTDHNETKALLAQKKAKKPVTAMFHNGVSAIDSAFESTKELGLIIVQELSSVRKERSRQLLLDDITDEVEFQHEMTALVASLAK